MKKRKVTFVLISLLLTLVMAIPVAAATKYYSFKNIGLDYSKGPSGLYGSGKNGFKQIKIVSIHGNKVKYKAGKFKYDEQIGHYMFAGYGKTMTAKLTSKTKYYYGNYKKAWNVHKNGGYHTNRFKTAKILERGKKNRIKTETYNSMYFAKMKNGKIITMVTGIVLLL